MIDNNIIYHLSKVYIALIYKPIQNTQMIMNCVLELGHAPVE